MLRSKHSLVFLVISSIIALVGVYSYRSIIITTKEGQPIHTEENDKSKNGPFSTNISEKEKKQKDEMLRSQEPLRLSHWNKIISTMDGVEIQDNEVFRDEILNSVQIRAPEQFQVSEADYDDLMSQSLMLMPDILIYLSPEVKNATEIEEFLNQVPLEFPNPSVTFTQIMTRTRNFNYCYDWVLCEPTLNEVCVMMFDPDDTTGMQAIYPELTDVKKVLDRKAPISILRFTVVCQDAGKRTIHFYLMKDPKDNVVKFLPQNSIISPPGDEIFVKLGIGIDYSNTTAQ